MTIKGDANNYRALKEELAPVLGELVKDMAELDRQTARIKFGATEVDAHLVEKVNVGVRSLLDVLGTEAEGILPPEDLQAYYSVATS